MGSSRKPRRGVGWRTWAAAGGVAVALTSALAATAPAASAQSAPTGQYVVSDSNGIGSAPARTDVLGVGGRVDADLDAADAVLADLTASQVAVLLETVPTASAIPNLAVSLTSATSTQSGAAPSAVFPQQSGATGLWSAGNSGSGVNVAVVDTGIDPLPDFAGRLRPGVDLTGEGNPLQDSFGHGTFVAGLIAGNGATSGGLYEGEAPGAGLVPVKVAGASGTTNLAQIIAGIDWVIAHRASEHIGVMNLSLGYMPLTSTVTDPLAQAVERAWDSGIAVVVSAGNQGPFNGTVLSPGDDPLVITVGAVNDHGSPAVSGDTMAAFSGAGPTTPDGWLKPDLVTSGTSVVSLEAPGSTVATENPDSVVGTGNFVGSGTSFSAAVTSGAVALVLAAHPDWGPDAVKAALLGTASAGPVGDPVVDGHGLLDVNAAASSSGLQLQQDFGQIGTTEPVPAGLQISPGQVVQANYAVQVPGDHAALTSGVSGGQLAIPVACQAGGAVEGSILVDVPTGTVDIAAGQTDAVSPPPGSAGSVEAPDLCEGGLMYGAGEGATVTFTGALTSTDLTDPQQVQASATVGSTAIEAGTATAVGTDGVDQGDTVQLSSSWAASTWNPDLWHGLPASVVAAGSAWNGSAWNGSAWNGSAWNGSAWNGSAWSGSAWSGSAWNGSAWNGSAWNGSAWNGSAWNGSAWNGSAWNGSAWNGSAWNGSAWNGSAWNGSAWNGSAWNGSAWSGSAWNGQTWS